MGTSLAHSSPFASPVVVVIDNKTRTIGSKQNKARGMLNCSPRPLKPEQTELLEENAKRLDSGSPADTC